MGDTLMFPADEERADELQRLLFGDDVDVVTAAAVLALDQETVKRKLRDAEIVGYKRGSQWYIPISEIQGYRDRQLEVGRERARIAAIEAQVRWHYQRVREADTSNLAWARLRCSECGTWILTRLHASYKQEERDGTLVPALPWTRTGECKACGSTNVLRFDSPLQATLEAGNLLAAAYEARPGDPREIEYRERCFEALKLQDPMGNMVAFAPDEERPPHGESE